MKELDKAGKEFLLNSIRCINDFPKPGIVFRDITTLLNNKEAFNFLMDHLVARYEDADIDFIAGIESRGFIFAAALAARLRLPFVPIRKPKKLPYITISQKYSLEYGVDEVQIHIDAFGEKAGAKVLLIDELINQTNAVCVEACFLIDLKDLGGSANLRPLTKIYSILEL